MSSNTVKTIYILDDDQAVRDALAILVRSVNHIPMEFSSALDFLENYQPEKAGCLITDVYLPGMDGVALQRHLNSKNCPIPIIVMSGHGDIPLAVKMIQRGALDFIEKPFSNHYMLERIQAALSLDEQRRQKNNHICDSKQHYDTLTPREKEVVEYLIQGLPNKVIAAQMYVSPRTIETHRANILKKMRIDSVVELVREIALIK